MKEKEGDLNRDVVTLKGKPGEFKDPFCRDAEELWLGYVSSDEAVGVKDARALNYDTGELFDTTVIWKGFPKNSDKHEKFGADTHLALTGEIAGHILLRASDYFNYIDVEDDWYLIIRPLLNHPGNMYAQLVVDTLKKQEVGVDEEEFMNNCNVFTREHG